MKSMWSAGDIVACNCPNCRQVVQSPPPLHPPPEQVAQRIAEAAALQHVPSDLVDRGPDVVRRSERVRPARPLAVPVSSGHYSRLP